MSAKIPLRILNIVNHRETSDHPMFMVVLTESEGDRRLPIIIGQPEAQAIAYSLDNFTPNRPLTHDLVHTLCDLFNIELVEVVITKIEAGRLPRHAGVQEGRCGHRDRFADLGCAGAGRALRCPHLRLR